MSRAGRPAVRIGLALLAGTVAWWLLFPADVVDTDPQQCYSIFGSGVWCDAEVAWIVGAAAAAVSWLALRLGGRRT